MCTCVLFLWWCPMINNSQNSLPDRCVCARVLRSFVLPFLSFFSSSLSVFLCPFIFTRRSLFTSKWPWSCSNIYIRKEERNSASSLLFLFHSFSRNSSLVYICMLARDQWMDITSHTNTRTYIYIYTSSREKKQSWGQNKKLALISFSLSLVFLFYIKNNDHNLSLSFF